MATKDLKGQRPVTSSRPDMLTPSEIESARREAAEAWKSMGDLVKELDARDRKGQSTG